MRPSVGATVARLSLQARSSDNEDFAVNVEIGIPYRSHEHPDTWACPVAVRPLYDRLLDQYGEDSFQALFLAMRLALVLLKDFTEKGGSLFMNGGGSMEDEGTFPFEAYLIGFGAMVPPRS